MLVESEWKKGAGTNGEKFDLSSRRCWYNTTQYFSAEIVFFFQFLIY